MGWGQWEVCLVSLGQDGAVSAAGPAEWIKIKQCDIMLGAHHRSLNLRQGLRGPPHSGTGDWGR